MNTISCMNDNSISSSKSHITDKINKKINAIYETLCKYAKENINNIIIIEKQLLIISNKINEILKINQDKNVKSIKLSFKSFSANSILMNTDKSKNNKDLNYYQDSIMNNNIMTSDKTNPNIFSEANCNKYLNYKLKRKLKHEHDKNKIKELEYLERIAVLQCKLNLYEHNFEKVLMENNLINNKKFRSIHNWNLNFKIKNRDKKEEKYLTRPLSSAGDDKKSSYLKKKFKKFVENHKIHNNSLIESFISANKLSSESNDYSYKKTSGPYKYQIGNNYLRNDFRQIKKAIHNNKTKITKFIDNCKKMF